MWKVCEAAFEECREHSTSYGAYMQGKIWGKEACGVSRTSATKETLRPE